MMIYVFSCPKIDGIGNKNMTFVSKIYFIVLNRTYKRLYTA